MQANFVDLGTLEGPVLLFGGPYSNLQALEALIAEARRMGISAENAICTGDVVAYCGSPAETTALIRDWGCHVVAGNCEEQLAVGAADCGCGFEEGTLCDALSAEWYAYASIRIVAEARAWMAGLPKRAVFTADGMRYAVIHGGANKTSRFLWPGDDKTDEIAALEQLVGPIDAVIGGHCGIAFTEPRWINAGVIGMPPHDGRIETEFCVLDGRPTLHRLPYDAEAANAAMTGRASPYAEALTTGLWPSEEILPAALRRRAAA
ncbi:MAG: metallophosphoesterase family protein [Pseudomonadota bacterium]